MLKDVTIRQLTENSPVVPSDTRQNVILSRQFLSDVLNMSYDRYRVILKNDFDKKLFLKKQQAKAEKSMPGLKAHIEELSIDLKNGITPMLSNYTTRSETLISNSSRSSSRKFVQVSDPTFDKTPHSKHQTSIRATTTLGNKSKNDKTLNVAQTTFLTKTLRSASINYNERNNDGLTKFESESEMSKIQDVHSSVMTDETLQKPVEPIIQQKIQKPIIFPNPKQLRPTSSRNKTVISKDKLNQLAMPRSSRRLLPFGRLSRKTTNELTAVSQIFNSLEDNLLDTPRLATKQTMDKQTSAVHDKRFRRLMTVFSETYRTKKLNENNVKSIVSMNSSLQDSNGHWQSDRNALKLEQLRHKREILAKQFPKDLFWIDAAA
ncbi:unnamed protein product [Didymodactylos carnosus]|uniref:Uncharacterized protein n=1 Tax=Didymodactylos carnosus TaxID=1234261 RepID=A0A813YP36_9BILA|nr:unnamed protein product [Didymodactylos carnosus]CAF0915115.1 unnamed protein product [Didymodactylos carnosus]CAF3671907.1 unnamed protein product [Didymodactylos carnosus]CAF3693529.1 unnamed protein product [Didymodactylos carnosus]